MVDRQRMQVTDADRQSFADKLQQLSTTLSPAEQVILVDLLARATGTEDDVQGFLMNPYDLQRIHERRLQELEREHALWYDAEPSPPRQSLREGIAALIGLAVRRAPAAPGTRVTSQDDLRAPGGARAAATE